MEKLVHNGGVVVPDWFTLNVDPATVALPDRKDVVVFSVQNTVAEPVPLPFVGDTVIHEPLPDVDQLPPVQPAGAPVIVTDCDPAW